MHPEAADQLADLIPVFPQVSDYSMFQKIDDLKIRPALNFGWESVLLLHLLRRGHSPEEILRDFDPRLKCFRVFEKHDST